VFFFQAEDGIRDFHVTGVQTCALPISGRTSSKSSSESCAPLGFSSMRKGTDGTGNIRPDGAARGCHGFGCRWSQPPRPKPRQKQIGRASCRERAEIWEEEGGAQSKQRD